MAFTGKEDHRITIDDARKIIANFRTAAATGEPVSGFFGKDTLLAILNQRDCVGIRFYFARKENGAPTLVLAGEDSKGVVLDSGILAEEPPMCPPFCDYTDNLR